MKDITGQVFGRLTAIAPTEERISSSIVWLCLCSCGNECKIPSAYLVHYITKSCGCLRQECSTEFCKHLPEYRSYCGAKQRCTNHNNDSYSRYGGRGIQMLFNSFADWLTELGPKPEPKELYSVDRIDNDGHYEPGNVRWATKEQQTQNRRKRAAAA